MGSEPLKPVTREEFFKIKADIFAPCALENQIGVEEAKSLQVRLVGEGANGPCSPDGEKILLDKGIAMLPDVLANAGGVTVSYFEWVQNRQGFYWREREINERLVDYMTHAFQATFATTDKYKTNPRIGAYILALDRVAQAMKYRGFYA